MNSRNLSRAEVRAICRDIALGLAEAGLPVFPCGRDKKPLVKWREAATTDRATIEGWWDRHPDALPAVPTGSASGLFVVDLDVPKAGEPPIDRAALEALGLDLDGHPYIAKTPSGGCHLIFPWSPGLPGNSVKKVPGVDIRSEGGYVIAWKLSALVKAAADPTLAPPPAALIAALTGVGTSSKSDAGSGGEEASAGDETSSSARDSRQRDIAYAEKALANEVTRVRSAPKGQRNNSLNSAAFSLGQLVGGGLLDEGRVAAALHDACRVNGLLAEDPCGVLKTILSGLTKGRAKPRVGPSSASGGGFGGFGGGGPSEDEWAPLDLTLLKAQRGAPPALPLDAVFGAAWAQWIAEAASSKSAPIDYVAAALLSVAASLIGNARTALPKKGWSEPSIIWSMIIGLPSAGKSPAIDAVIDPLRALEAVVRKDATAKRADWSNLRDIADAALKDWKAKCAAAAGSAAPPKPAIPDPGPEPNVPVLAVNDATIEKLAMIAAVQRRGLFMLRDELAGWLSDMVRYANGSSDRSFWIDAFGGRARSVERVKRESVFVEHLSISVLGGIQPDPLASHLLRGKDDDGLLARFLAIWPDSVEPGMDDVEPDMDFARRAFERLYGLSMLIDGTGVPGPIAVPFTDAARDKVMELKRWAKGMEEKEAGLLVSFIGKTPGLVVRAALVLAHLDWAASAEPVSPTVIGIEHVERARRYVIDYAIPMARRAYAEASTPAEERGARLLARLIAKERLESFSLRDITRRERQGLRTHEEVEKAVEVLLHGGWVKPVKLPAGPDGGRPRYFYRVNPALDDLL